MSNPRPARFYYVAASTFANYVHRVQKYKKKMIKAFKCRCVTVTCTRAAHEPARKNCCGSSSKRLKPLM